MVCICVGARKAFLYPDPDPNKVDVALQHYLLIQYIYALGITMLTIEHRFTCLPMQRPAKKIHLRH
jgi:hypothetical protein